MREKAIAEYHELLRADGGLTAELLARLKEGMRAARLLYGEREIGVSLRPHLLTRPQYDALAHASEVLAGAFEKLAEAFVADPSLLDTLGVTERERRLALAEPGYGCPAVTTRLDAFVRGREIKFVEYNAENPSSLTDQAGLNHILFDLPAMRELAARYRLRQFDPAAALLSSILETYREWGGEASRAPRVAIVDWVGLPTAHEFELLRNYFASRCVPTVVCSPGELEYDGRALRRGDFRIDLVYKRVIIHELLSRFDDTHPLLAAYLDGRVCVVNSFRCKPLHKKAIFELLTGDDAGCRFDARETEVISACIPWTRRLYERRTLHAGREVDLLEHVRRQRDAFVLKPNDDYGGHGLLLGRGVSESEWEAALSSALAGDYVVQEALELHTEEFPVFDERAWSLQQMFVDTNPVLFRGRMQGAMVRLSDSPVVNVTSGGGETGFFVIEGEA